MKTRLVLVWGLIFLSIAMTMLGGLLDMTGKPQVLGITKHHAWNDGLYLLVLAGLVAVLTSATFKE